MSSVLLVPTRTLQVSCPANPVPALKDRVLPERRTCLSVEVMHIQYVLCPQPPDLFDQYVSSSHGNSVLSSK